MFKNPRRSRQTKNFTTTVPKILDLKSSTEQIFFRKLSLGAPFPWMLILDHTFLYYKNKSKLGVSDLYISFKWGLDWSQYYLGSYEIIAVVRELAQCPIKSKSTSAGILVASHADATLGTRGFSRVRREFSVFGRRRAGHYKDLTETGNRARKVSGTQGTLTQERVTTPKNVCVGG